MILSTSSAVDPILSADRGRVRAETMTKGTDKYMGILIAKSSNGFTLDDDVPQLDNIKLVCKKHVDDTNYMFKLDFIEEQGKENPKVTAVPHKRMKGTSVYTFHITPDMTQDIIPGKYWYGISFITNGAINSFGSNVLTIEPNITDDSGGQYVQFEEGIDGNLYEF